MTARDSRVTDLVNNEINMDDNLDSWEEAAERVIERFQKRVEELEKVKNDQCATGISVYMERERYRDRLDRMVAAVYQGWLSFNSLGCGEDECQECRARIEHSDRVWHVERAMELLAAIDAEVDK